MMTFLFHFSAAVVLPFWGAMILFPKSERTEWMVRSPWIILPPVACYLAFILPNLGEALAAFGDPSPETLALMMAKPWAASLFWAYAGAFDLFVGRWMFFDARERGLNPWAVSPVLFLAIFFGPFAFALYAALVAAHRVANGPDHGK